MPCKKLLISALVMSCFSLSTVSLVHAQSSGLLDGETGQTNPKSRPVNMSLTISDTEAPTTPVLIAPSNGATLTTTTPSFVWEESTDNFSMSYYKLTLDGSVLFDSIPLTDTTNGSYTLTKTATQYTLVPISPLTNGSHTWKITAVDINGNSSESTTWSFTISTITPTATPTLSPNATATAAVTTTPEPEATSVVPATTEPTGTPSVTATPAPTQTIAEVIAQLPETVIEAVEEVAQNTGPVGTIVISGAVPLATTALFASQFGWGISFQVLLRILQALGILPPPAPQGLVFNSETEEPVAFAILNIGKIGDESTKETVVTNTDGVYGGIQLPPGKYQIEVRHQDFVFPTGKTRPPYLTMFEFYKQEAFEVSNEKTKQLFLIPVDPLRAATQTGSRLSWHLIRERLIRLSQYLLLPLFLISAVITYFFPTTVNFVVCGIYVIIIAFRVLRWFKTPVIVGKVVDSAGTPLSNVFVRIFLQESNQLMSVLVTDAKGKFRAFLPKNEYQIALSKQKYVWVDNNEIQNFFLADARKAKVVILAVMEASQKLFTDLFN